MDQESLKLLAEINRAIIQYRGAVCRLVKGA